jgi:hypothetical protein
MAGTMAQLDSQGLPLPTTSGLGARGGRPTRLSAEIWLFRHGWALPTGALLLLLAAVLLVTQVLPAQDQVDLLQSRLQSAQTRPKTVPSVVPALPIEPGQLLRDLLSEAEGNPAQVRRIASIARQNGISLPRAQYSSSRQTPSGIEHTDITFSFVAGYPQSRAFIEGVLRELPNASVDRVSFERDQAQGAEAEITLRLTLWRWPAPFKPEAVR